ncbi:hypothetical protein ACTI_85650 [Actinoplanes sp. OR16]|nr:hypothetical protein ACTI_85650 [Actinoplanes sp. OR16]
MTALPPEPASDAVSPVQPASKVAVTANPAMADVVLRSIDNSFEGRATEGRREPRGKVKAALSRQLRVCATLYIGTVGICVTRRQEPGEIFE